MWIILFIKKNSKVCGGFYAVITRWEEKKKKRPHHEKVATSANVFDAAAGDTFNQNTSVCRRSLNLVFGRDVFYKVEVIPKNDTMELIQSEN